jgi:predicted MFS family arabinose efflux permease
VNAPSGEPRLLSGPAGRALTLLTVANLLGYLDRFVVSSLVESLRADLWLTDARLGWLMTGFVVVYMLASPVFEYTCVSRTNTFTGMPEASRRDSD